MSRYHYKFATLTDEGIVTGITTSRGVKTFWGEGVTHTVTPPAYPCKGLSGCDTIPRARDFVAGDVLLVVIHGGVVITEDGKNTCETQTVVAAYDASDYEEAPALSRAAYYEVAALAWKAYYEAVRDTLCTPERLLFGDDSWTREEASVR